MSVFDQLKELNSTNSSKVKLNILKSFKDDEFLKNIFRYTYDKVDYTYGVTSRTIQEFPTEEAEKVWNEGLTFNYPRMFELLERLSKREFTGHKALAVCKYFCLHNESERVDLFLKIIDRDLKVGINETTLNKVWRCIVPKPKYCRCSVLSKKLADKINFPCYIQLKCDGTYRECYVYNGKVEFKTRSGEPYSDPILENIMSALPNGYYTGEFTIGKADEPDANRSVGNGNINSDNPDFKNIHYTIWDYLSPEEYRGDIKTPYSIRFNNLKNTLKNLHSNLVHIVPSYEVQNLKEALKITSDFMNRGLEGGVLKDKNLVFKNGTSNQQLKIKLKVDADLRVVEFLKGNKGTKYETKNKIIVYRTDDGKIQGQCSGMNDAMIDEVTKNPDKYIGKIVAVQFNDLMKAEGHEYYALSHPRFQEFRTDKLESDSFERVKQLRDMAKSLA